ncbi:uncharacterized protein LOC118438982 [Folsomia candida]|nr:uncharacterized protein LOC118438982 [Folsomia candida]
MWALDGIHYLQVESLQFLSKRGGKYIPTPQHLSRKGIINIRTNSSCFAMSVAASLFLDRIRLEEAPDLEYDQLPGNQKRRHRHKWTDHESYMQIIQTLQDEGSVRFTEFIIPFQEAYYQLPVGQKIIVNVLKHSAGQLHMPEEYDVEALGDELVNKLAAEGINIGFLLNDDNLVEIRLKTLGAKFKLSTHLNQHLNLEDNFEFTEDTTEFNVPTITIPSDDPAPDSLPIPNAAAPARFAHVVVDIIESQRFGQNVRKVIPTFSRSDIKGRREIVFDSVQYLPVTCKEHKSMHVQICETFTPLTPPSSQPTVAVLHFRRQKI